MQMGSPACPSVSGKEMWCDCYFVELCVIWNICTHAYKPVVQCIVLTKVLVLINKDSEMYLSESRVVTTPS